MPAVAVGGMLLLSATLLLSAAAAHGQGLEELRSDVRTNGPGEPSVEPPIKPRDEEPYEDHDGDGHDDDSWPLDGLLGAGVVGVAALTGMVITSPFWGPPVWVGDSYMQPGYFPRFPHQYDHGYMMIGPPEAAGIAGPRQPHAVAIRGRTEFGTDFADVQWIGGHVLIETTPRWGVESDFRHVREDILQGFDDALWLGDANLTFRFAQSPWLLMRTGLGFNYLSDAIGSDFGFNFTYGGDFFPIRPLVLSGELDLGTLGHTNVWHARATLGANWRIAEAFLGYDYYDIGPTQISGFVAGVRLWF
jgi:hypothetical protein